MDLADGMVAVGLAALAVGLWFVDFRLALVVVGGLLLLMGWIAAWRKNG